MIFMGRFIKSLTYCNVEGLEFPSAYNLFSGGVEVFYTAGFKLWIVVPLYSHNDTSDQLPFLASAF